MKVKLLHVIFLFFPFTVVFGQSYYVSVRNTLYYQNTGSSSYCFKSNPASIPNGAGYLRLVDKNDNILKETDGNFLLNRRPAKFIERSGACRWIEGSNRGSTYSLGGYTFVIPEGQNYYYEVRTFSLASPASASILLVTVR